MGNVLPASVMDRHRECQFEGTVNREVYELAPSNQLLPNRRLDQFQLRYRCALLEILMIIK